MDFVCQQCGQCCHRNTPFTVYEWEVDYLEHTAAKQKYFLDIRPDIGFLDHNRFLVFSYLWYIHGKCIFLDPNNHCQIHAHKPLMCALYPYLDKILPDQTSWACYWEKIHNKDTQRDFVYKDPQIHLAPSMAYSALFLRFFSARDRIDHHISQYDHKLSEDFSPKMLQIKPLFRELIRIGKLSSKFIKLIKKINFANITGLSQLYLKLHEDIPYCEVNDAVRKQIFNSWASSSYEWYHHNPKK